MAFLTLLHHPDRLIILSSLPTSQGIPELDVHYVSSDGIALNKADLVGLTWQNNNTVTPV
uniref:Uncharacterized protein n=1 Tax=Oryza meridionalis TaxID=40149 RepID=A0A0E0ET48_9ORYZ